MKKLLTVALAGGLGVYGLNALSNWFGSPSGEGLPGASLLGPSYHMGTFGGLDPKSLGQLTKLLAVEGARQGQLGGMQRAIDQTYGVGRQ
jgi:hypothetical protein